MGKFKRVSLAGSEELFRNTGPRLFEEDEDTITELVERKPKPGALRQFEFSPAEVELLLEAIHTAKYPERAKGKLPLDRFERYDALRNKLQGRDD
jgi:hypothetical protein